MMRKIILLSMVFWMPPDGARAQQYHMISHTSGDVPVQGNYVTVTQTGKPTTGDGLCGYHGYWIGYGQNNGYGFAFEKPIDHIRLRAMVINNGELIHFKINGQDYMVRQDDIKPFNGDLMEVPLAQLKDGNLTSDRQYCNAEVDIKPGYPIETLEVLHLNGKQGGAGIVFDLAMVQDDMVNSSGNSQHAGNSTYVSNVYNGRIFQILPNPATDKVNIQFLSTIGGQAVLTITDVLGKKLMQYSYQCQQGQLSDYQFEVAQLAPGSYNVTLRCGTDTHNAKLVKL